MTRGGCFQTGSTRSLSSSTCELKKRGAGVEMKDWQPFVRLLEKKFSTLQETKGMIEEMRRFLKGESDEKRVDAIMEMVSKLLSEHPYGEANRRLCSLFIKNTLVLHWRASCTKRQKKRRPSMSFTRSSKSASSGSCLKRPSLKC